MRIFSGIFLLLVFSSLAVGVFAQKKLAIAADDIREIILETGDGFCADCERTITLRADDARATYHGGKNSRVRKGDFSGEFAAKDFTKLAQKFIASGFFDLAPRYEGRTSDAATVKITVISKDGSKTVENFKCGDEPRFKKIERAFNAAADKIKWLDDKPEERRLPEFDEFSFCFAP